MLHKAIIKERTRINKKTGVVTKDWEINFGRVNGKYIRHFKKTYKEAQKTANDLYMGYRRKTEEAMALTSSQINECAMAFSILRENNCHDSIIEIVRGHIKRINELSNTSATVPLTTLGALRLAYEEEVGRKPLSDVYRSIMSGCLRRFEETIGKDTVCASLTTHAVVVVIERMTKGVPKTYNNIFGYVATMFRWGVKRKQIAENPLEGAEKKRILYKEPGFFTPDMVQDVLLEGMNAPNADKYMPWLILGFFCGIRTAEIGRLSWENIKWDAKTPKVRVEKPKGHASGTKPRLVTLNDAALAWLSLYRKDSGPIGSELEFGKWKRGLKSFPRGSHNAMRHTFASAHYAMYEDLYKTAKELGHYQNVQTSLNHYIGLMQDDDAEEFWALRPPVKADGGEVAAPAAQEPKDEGLPRLFPDGVPVASAV